MRRPRYVRKKTRIASPCLSADFYLLEIVILTVSSLGLVPYKAIVISYHLIAILAKADQYIVLAIEIDISQIGPNFEIIGKLNVGRIGIGYFLGRYPLLVKQGDSQSFQLRAVPDSRIAHYLRP